MDGILDYTEFYCTLAGYFRTLIMTSIYLYTCQLNNAYDRSLSLSLEQFLVNPRPRYYMRLRQNDTKQRLSFLFSGQHISLRFLAHNCTVTILKLTQVNVQQNRNFEKVYKVKIMLDYVLALCVHNIINVPTVGIYSPLCNVYLP